MSRLVIIVPHPDDESALCGGLIARAADRSIDVKIVFVTSGTHGRTLGLCKQGELAPTRKAEAKSAGGVLGVKDIRFLDYPDYDPRAEKKFDWPGAERKLRAAVGKDAGTVIVTFPPNGINGHPDHVRCAGVARQLAEEKDFALLHVTTADSGTPYMMDAASYMNARDRQKIYLKPTHVMKLTPAEMEKKLWALSHYRTQALSVVDFIRKREGNMSKEYYSLGARTGKGSGKFIAGLLRGR